MRLTHLLTLTTLNAALCSGAAAKIEKPDFNKHIKPILEAACVHCHSEKSDKGGLKLTTLEEALKMAADLIHGRHSLEHVQIFDAEKGRYYDETEILILLDYGA